MNFLAPLFLLGALAIAGPVIFHLIRRTTKERQRFGSLMFLEPTPPRLTRRSRIEHWLLLILRAAALALLALAFSRPFFRTTSAEAAASGAANRTVVLVDTSASLRREGLWNLTKERALRAVDEAGGDGDVSLVTFDRAVTTLVTFEDWQRTTPEARAALARERLDSASPSWAGTDAASALMAAAEMLADTAGRLSGKHEVILVTDAQEGSRLEALHGYEWPEQVSLRIETIVPKRPGNAGLQLATESRASGPDANPGVHLKVGNSTDATSEAFQVGWRGDDGKLQGSAVDVYVPPGQSRMVMLPWPAGTPTTGRVLLRGDTEEFDNIVTVTPPPSVTVPVIHSGHDEPRGPLSFLKKALPASRALTASLSHHAPDALPAPDVLKAAPLWIVTAPLDSPAATAANKYVTGGGTVLIMLHTPEMAAAVQTITGSAPLTVEAVKPKNFALLGTIDFSHSLFSAFAEPRFSDFTKIRFMNYCKLDAAALTGARIIAKFDSGDPALIDVPQKKGRVFILCAAWHPPASQFALSSKFPSLIGSLLALTDAGAQTPIQFVAGESAPVSMLAPAAAETISITSPSGQSAALARTDVFHGFTEPGLYRATWDGGQRDVAVNPDPAESRTAPLAVEDFERAGAPVVARSQPAAVKPPSYESLAAAAEAEGRQKLWRWLLAGVMTVLLIETLLGTRTARSYSATEQQPAQ